MPRDEAMVGVCGLVAAARHAGGEVGPYPAFRGGRGLFVNAGGMGAFLADEDLADLAASGYLAVRRDGARHGEVTLLAQAFRVCGARAEPPAPPPNGHGV